MVLANTVSYITTLILSIVLGGFGVSLLVLCLFIINWMGRIPNFRGINPESVFGSNLSNLDTGSQRIDLVSIDIFIILCFTLCLLMLVSSIANYRVLSRVTSSKYVMPQLCSILSVTTLITSFLSLAILVFLPIHILYLSPMTMHYTFVDMWNEVPIAGRSRVQDTLKCCGLMNLGDRVADSSWCPVTVTAGFTEVYSPSSANTSDGIEPRMGCWPKLDRFLGTDEGFSDEYYISFYNLYQNRSGSPAGKNSTESSSNNSSSSHHNVTSINTSNVTVTNSSMGLRIRQQASPFTAEMMEMESSESGASNNPPSAEMDKFLNNLFEKSKPPYMAFCLIILAFLMGIQVFWIFFVLVFGTCCSSGNQNARSKRQDFNEYQPQIIRKSQPQIVLHPYQHPPPPPPAAAAAVYHQPVYATEIVTKN